MASAMPKTPSGNSTRRSEKYSQEILPVVRKEAIRVSINRLICTMETANRIGSINFNILLTPARSRFRPGRGSSLNFHKNGSCNKSWATPAINTPQASALTGVSKSGASQMAQPISDRFNRAGVKAGTANCLKVFRIPPAKAVSEINSR